VIKRLQASTDRAAFESWAQGILQTPFFNWTTSELLEALEKEECWGHWRNEKLTSVVCFLQNSDPLEILWLATNPDFEGQGLMKTLLEKALYDAQNRKSRQDSQVVLEVHEKNLKAIKLYAALGFIEVGRRKNYYKDGGIALLMTRKPSKT
jgi:ribosomal-protein-alanine N-acetyltransferase